MVGWQEGHPDNKEPHSSNPQRFSSGTRGGGGTEGEPADPGSRGKMSVKWKYM